MAGFEVIGNEELNEICDVFSNGGILLRHGFEASRNGLFKVRDFERQFASKMGVQHALAVSSGTAALRVALAAFDIGAGDEVITQSFTFVATVEAIIESRATPICAEIDETLNMSPEDLLRKITPKTKAVIVVHMLGSPARLPEISKICQERGLILIEDTAWGCGGHLQGRPLGTWGDAGTFSFDYAKTITTGEGGMVVFQDENCWRKAFAWHDHGHENNPALPRWEDTRSGSGFNYRMMELQGALGIAQLKKLSHIVDSHRKNRDRLWAELEGIPGLQQRATPEGSYDTADALVLLTKNNAAALRCRQELVNAGLATKILPEAYTWHFAGTWNHMPELVMAHRGNLNHAFPKSQELLARAVALPVSVKQTKDLPRRVKSAITRALEE